MANLMEPVVEGGWEAVEEEEGCGAGCGFDGDEGIRVAAVGCECITRRQVECHSDMIQDYLGLF